MYEKLEGRVKYEKADQSIHLKLPARRGPFAAVYAPLVTIWLVLATIRYAHLLEHAHLQDTEFLLQMTAMGIYVVGFVYFMGWVAWTTTGETVVELSPPDITISTRVFGVSISTRTFTTSQVHRMRFIAPHRFFTQRSVLNPNSSCIRFEANKSSHNYARGVTESEARAMIDTMLRVYEFPRSWF